MKAAGRATVVGDDVDTDVIFPARYLAVLSREDQAKYLFEPLGPQFRERLSAGGVLVAGWNFGCGSSREHAVTALLGADVKLVIAKSFSRIFFRNAVNLGLPVVAAPDLVSAIRDGDDVEVDLSSGLAQVGKKYFSLTPLPPNLLAILAGGGLWATRQKKSNG